MDELEIGKINTIKVKVLKYNFPRIRNLPSKVMCDDTKGKIDIVFFNSREGYIKIILPIDAYVVISGKVGYFKKKYQITNPAYVVPENEENNVNKVIPKYSLTEGLSEKVYIKIINQVLDKIKDFSEWHDYETLKKIGNIGWKEAIFSIHNNKEKNLTSSEYKRLAYDEILANLLVLSQARKRIKKYKKKKKKFDEKLFKKIIKKINFELTSDQYKAIYEINKDLSSEFKMFRLLQGDVGSGKTIVSLVAAANVIKSNYQVALMAPTEILAKQHYALVKNLFKSTDFNISLLTGKTEYLEKKIYTMIWLMEKLTFS